ncbi:conserved hypothetical protein [Tenacibaculum maritimum]|uniref:hypothetical protein n=1 Tax=Tenacibaculum maritimum TaxID=107401 RepID=UPI0012E46626|nr:hypothetical protein [Tenacibaculum maritimum]CAA0252889.1 conserved hypothetical protein [Tenacibaculum maritimum]
MKKQSILNISILLIPLLIVVLVNEYSRLNNSNKGFVRKGITAINPSIKTPEKCSWYCHADTGYCKKYHTHLLKNHTSKIDPFYFGIIKSLHVAGDYGLANIIFLVILFPTLIYVLLIKSISIQRKIKELKNG